MSATFDDLERRPTRHHARKLSRLLSRVLPNECWLQGVDDDDAAPAAAAAEPCSVCTQGGRITPCEASTAARWCARASRSDGESQLCEPRSLLPSGWSWMCGIETNNGTKIEIQALGFILSVLN